MVPLYAQEEDANKTTSPLNSTNDLVRTKFFQINKRWDNGARQAIRYAMSFAQRYAEQGDYEVSKNALDTILVVNATYIEAKGKTFYANNPFFDNPLAHDSFISDTLEYLRQSVQAALSRRDEQQIVQILRAMSDLHQIDLGIDYSDPHIMKSHSAIAAGYLADAIHTMVPHNMADVLLEGQRLMGKSAQHILIYGSPNDITALSEKIALISCTGSVKENYRLVTFEGMKQLANLTFDLFYCKNHHIDYAVNEIRQDVTLIVKCFLKIPDTSLPSIHTYFLSPYYSSTSVQSLRAQLTSLVDEISEAKPENANAKLVIRNIEQWADGMYKTEKDLLLAVIKAKSSFTFDMICWITGVTEILLAVSNAPTCDEYLKQKIQDHARWLIMTLYCIPDDKDTLLFVENFQMTETLFTAIINARKHGCEKIATEIEKMLLSWIFKNGKYETGWRILEKGLCGLAAFTLMEGNNQDLEFKTAVATKLSSELAPTQETRDRVSMAILERTTSLQQAHWSSLIDSVIEQADRQKLQPLLKEIAKLLSPNAAH